MATTEACLKCGQCCKRIAFRFAPPEYNRLLIEAHYGRPVQDIWLRIRHRCKQLDENNRCIIYKDRPQQCRDFLCQVATGDIPPRLMIEVSDEEVR